MKIRRCVLAAALAALGTFAAGATTREEALAAKQKATAALKASQAALAAAQQENRRDLVARAQQLIAQNRQKLAEAEALLRSLQPPEDPLRDCAFVAAALENARKEADAAGATYDEAIIHMLVATDALVAERAVDEAETRLLKLQQTVRDLRTKRQDLEHPQLMADMQHLRQDPALAAELDQVLQRIRQNELDQLKLREEIGSDTLAVRLELKKLKDSGALRDTTDLLSRAQTDPRVHSALDRARARIMHDQADILRDSTDTLRQEVQRLKQKLTPPAR